MEFLEFKFVEAGHGFLFLVKLVEVGFYGRELDDVLFFRWVGEGGLEELCLAITLLYVLVKDL